MANCEREEIDCMIAIAKEGGVDRIIYGHVSGSVVRLKLLVVATRLVVSWETGAFSSSDPKIRATGREAMASLLSRSP
jgi:hypothetical protein